MAFFCKAKVSQLNYNYLLSSDDVTANTKEPSKRKKKQVLDATTHDIRTPRNVTLGHMTSKVTQLKRLHRLQFRELIQMKFLYLAQLYPQDIHHRKLKIFSP